MNWLGMGLRAGLAFLLVLIGAQCSHVRYHPHAARHGLGPKVPCVLNGRELSRATEQSLREFGMTPKTTERDYKRAFDRSRDKLEEERGDMRFQQAFLETCLAAAQEMDGARFGSEGAAQAFPYYLLAARRAGELMQRYDSAEWPFLYQLGQYATSRVVEAIIGAEGDPLEQNRALEIGHQRLVVEIESEISGLTDLVAADRLSVRQFPMRVRQLGSGAPFVGRIASQEDEEFAPPGGLYLPVNAELCFLDGGGIKLCFYDLMRSSTLPRDQVPQDLAADFTAAWGRQLDALPESRRLSNLFRPAAADNFMGLALLEPFRSDAIPVVFIHGLASGSQTWKETVNGLLADQGLRERYQFWVFQYPSGYPFLHSASELRRALRRVRTKFDPERRSASFDQMVLVGHSLGGLIASAQVRLADESTWERYFKKPLPLVTSDEQQQEALRDHLFLDDDRFVKRVVFIATPHRGSSLADSWVGRLGSRLIDLPQHLVAFDIAGIVQDVTDAGISVLDLGPNSVARLQYYHPTLKGLLDLPLDPGVKVHTIVGDRGLGNAPKSSDGLVSYASSHLEEAASEKIVPSWHGAHHHCETIAELRRILRSHLGLGDSAL